MKKTLILATICALASCRTSRYVPIETIRTDTVYVSRNVRDSIWQHDSVHVKEYVKGDTIYSVLTKWRNKYIERTTHDTLYMATHDTIPEPYPVPEYIEKKLSWWQQTRIHVGEACLVILLLWGGWKAVRLYIRG